MYVGKSDHRALPWTGVLAKKIQRPIPMQDVPSWEVASDYMPFKNMFGRRSIDEDCLYLNVFVPEMNTTPKLPVSNDLILL